MITQTNTKLPLKLVATMLSVGIFAFALAPGAVLAQSSPADTDYGLTEFTELGLGQSDDLKGSIANIINIILGFLGIVAVIIILAGGFKWMTAGGNEDKVAEARQMIIQGLIGLVVVFAAWAIASFVVTNLQSATAA